MNLGGPIIIFGGSAALSGLAVLLSIRVARRWNFLDYPDMPRKTQAVPIPKLGGVAVAFGFFTSGITALLVTNQPSLVEQSLAIFIPALGLAVLGFVDDRRLLDPYIRLACQATLAALAWFLGIRPEFTTSAAVNFALFILWVVTMVNAINLLDNSDGLAGSSVAIAALGASVVSLLAGQQVVLVLAIALCGTSVGFLIHNWNPARVYLGDAGAYFLGFVLAVLIIELEPASAPRWVGAVIAISLVALPLADLVFVVLRRSLAGIHPFTAGRDHLSHTLLSRGNSVPGAVLRLQIVNVAGCSAAVLLALAYF